MQKLAVKQNNRRKAEVSIDSGVLDDPLHPMHQALLDRWTARPEQPETKFSPPARLVIALGSAAMAWALVIGAGMGIASLV